MWMAWENAIIIYHLRLDMALDKQSSHWTTELAIIIRLQPRIFWNCICMTLVSRLINKNLLIYYQRHVELVSNKMKKESSNLAELSQSDANRQKSGSGIIACHRNNFFKKYLKRSVKITAYVLCRGNFEYDGTKYGYSSDSRKYLTFMCNLSTVW